MLPQRLTFETINSSTSKRTNNFLVPQAGEKLCDRKIAASKRSLRNNVKRKSNVVETTENIKRGREFLALGNVGTQLAV